MAETFGTVLRARRQAEYEVLQAGRQQQKTATFKAEYGVRAGVEGTIAQGVRRSGLRRARYRGAVKTHLQQVGTAVGLNLVRVSNWLADTPLAQTRRSHFAALQGAGG